MNYINFDKAKYIIDKVDISAKPDGGDKLVIYLSLDAHTEENLGEFVPTELRLYTETGLKTGLKTLAKIGGKQFSYKKPNAGGIYVSEHDDIKQSVVDIAEKDGRLYFVWTGKIDVPEDLFPADTIGTEFTAEFDTEIPEPEKIYNLNLFESKISVIDKDTILEFTDTGRYENECRRVYHEIEKLDQNPATRTMERTRWARETFCAELSFCITVKDKKYNGKIIRIGDNIKKENVIMELDPECPVEIEIVNFAYYGPNSPYWTFKYKIKKKQ